MPKLFFIRHGQTETNIQGIIAGRIDTVLTQKGLDDAVELGKNLNEHFDYYYCSPLKRAQQTIKAIAGDVDYKTDERVIEVYPGDWQGKHVGELPKEEDALYRKGLYTPPNAETQEEVSARARSFVDDMFSRYGKDDIILIVTHNAFMRSLKRLFVTEEFEQPKNLEMFVVDDEMYKSIKV